MLKDLHLQNRFANESQILCGAYLGRGNESLLAPSGSHDQDGRHAIYGKFGNLGFSIKKVKTVDFSETIAAGDPKVSRSRRLIKYMKICEY